MLGCVERRRARREKGNVACVTFARPSKTSASMTAPPTAKDLGAMGPLSEVASLRGAASTRETPYRG